MLRPTRWWWGMMCVATLACGDEGPLEGPTVRAVARDLEFVLPGVRPDSRVFSRSGGDSTAARETTVPEGHASLEGEKEVIIPKIFSTSISSWFDDATLHFAYGLHGYGNGYSITPNGMLMRATDQSVILPSLGGGAGLDWLVPTYIWGNYRESRLVGVSCGLLANFSPRFEVRVSLVGMKYLPNMMEYATGSSAAQQPACPSTVGFSGNGVITTTTQYKICYWDIWIDSYGNVVDILPLGCYPLQV